MSQNILVVDDEESIRYTFENFLGAEGYRVYTVKDYDGALQSIKQTAPDVIFADIILGDGTGIDVLREVRQRNLRSPVIIITGAPDIENASESLRLGAFDYLTKPVRQETLLQVTRLALKHKQVSDEREEYRSNLEAIFRSVKDGIVTVDNGCRVVALNDSARKICTFPGRETISRDFAVMNKACAGSCVSVLQETIQKKRFVEKEHLECRHRYHPRQTVTVTASPLLGTDGLFSGAVMVIRDETRLTSLERDLQERERFFNIVGRSKNVQKIYSLIEALGDVATTVLITGESGTGKELVAEALHYAGQRKNNPLVKVNCSALSESLLESELFGHVRGAFTHAVKDKVGRLEKADGGTIFFDEIGDISPAIQARLLRVLQEMEFERVGDSTPIKVDVRVVAATNQDLQKKVDTGEFRKDLYYRLRVMDIVLPPLRDRREDIPLLTRHFIEELNKKLHKTIKTVSLDVQKLFMTYPWPGNVRELKNTLEHAFILCSNDTISVEHLPVYFMESKDNSDVPSDGAESIVEALRKAGWNKSRAAKLLGISRKTLYRKMQKYDIADDPGKDVR